MHEQHSSSHRSSTERDEWCQLRTPPTALTSPLSEWKKFIPKWNPSFLVYSAVSNSQLFATPWTVARQDPVSMRFPKQEYWSGLPFPPPGDLPNPGIKPKSPVSPELQADSLPLSHQGSLWVEQMVAFLSGF